MECESDKAWGNTFSNNIPSLDTGMVKWQTAEKLFSVEVNTLKIMGLSTD